MVRLSRLVGRMTGMRPHLAETPSGLWGPLPGPPRVVVAGGGIAGASAAVVLAERGIPVLICEAAGRLGGRLGAHPHTLPDGTVQWIDHGFHGFTSIADPGVLDSVTLYHRFEAAARGWHERTGGSVIELHAYACPPGVAAAELGAAMLAELGRLWPETRSLRQLDRYCHVGADAAGFPVGGHATTPGVHTAVPGLTLAGDWVATPFPSALMERAATTGVGAANTILAARGYRTEPVWSVPPRGILAGRYAAAMRRQRAPLARAQ